MSKYNKRRRHNDMEDRHRHIMACHEPDLRRTYHQGVRAGMDRPVAILLVNNTWAVACAHKITLAEARGLLHRLDTRNPRRYLNVYHVVPFADADLLLTSNCGDQWAAAKAKAGECPERFLAAVIEAERDNPARIVGGRISLLLIDGEMTPEDQLSTSKEEVEE
jgi:hypothetical protein